MRNILFVLSAFILFSCSSEEQFSETKDGFKYKIIRENKDADTTYIGATVEINAEYYGPDDSLLFQSIDIGPNFRMRIKTPNPSTPSNIDNALLMLNEGDSGIFYINAGNFYHNTRNINLPKGIKETDMLRFHIGMEKVISTEELDELKKKYFDKLKKEEEGLLKDFVEINFPSIKQTESGFYIDILSEGKGKPASEGDSVIFHYEGKFLTGEYFGSSLASNKPLTYSVGSPLDIKAWEETLSTLPEGGKAMIIVPSHLAYGEQGYGNLIKPYTSLIFEIEVLKIERK